MKEILGGKYEFVLTTQIDKGHIYNRLIFNAVSFTDHKHYHSNKHSYLEIHRASDQLCREHGLAVIVPGRDKGKSYIKHQTAQNDIGYRAKLKATINWLIPGSSSLDELLARLQREGYEIKRGRNIAGPGAVHPARTPGLRLYGRSRCIPNHRRPQALQTAPAAQW